MHRFVVVDDLGLDKVLVYRFDSAAGKLTPNDPPYLKVAPGSGPRHFAFHQNKPWAYGINEMACTINALHYTPEGKFEIVQTVSTIPGRVKPEYSTAEIAVHPSGKFVYGSNRGQNTIACFKIDQSNGKLEFVERQGQGVNVPRSFAIDPTGKYMIVANQDGHSVIVFTIDPETGKLTPTKSKIEVGSPVCVEFLAK
jgi:6-phosphogluconolactonase